MIDNYLLEAGVMMEMARTLTPLERQIIQSLHERGPAMPLEIAVRVLIFPDEVGQPLANLREKNLVQMSEISGARFGNELVFLTRYGEQLAHLLHDEVFLRQLENAERASQAAPDPRQQEVELLSKLGKLAEENGDTGRATIYYEQALEVTRTLTTTTGNS